MDRIALACALSAVLSLVGCDPDDAATATGTPSSTAASGSSGDVSTSSSGATGTGGDGATSTGATGTGGSGSAAATGTGGSGPGSTGAGSTGSDGSSSAGTGGASAATTGVGGAGGSGTGTGPDPCSVDNGGCDDNATCLVVSGNVQCACNMGYSGNGMICSDIDECATNNGGCSANATCTNLMGSRSCACNMGYTGNGITCSDVDECAMNNGGCHPQATCTNLPGSSSCACNAGYTGDGINCQDIDECGGAPCATQATCTNTPGGFSCTCNPPYVGNGLSCTCGSTPPVADAGVMLTPSIGATFQLDGSASAGGSLTYSWAPVGSAPPLSGANSAQPSGVATTCVPFTYQLTVTDACGQTSSDTVTVDPLADGPYVSADTCTASVQCGTIQLPWCTIALGVSKTATTPLMVAAAMLPYTGASMRDGVDVLGGYEPTFTSPRNPNPLTNGTKVKTALTAFTWPNLVDATLDGFAIWAEHTTGAVPSVASVLLVNNGNAIISNVDIDGPSTNFASDAAALSVQSGGFALVQGASVLRGPRASSSSTGASLSGSATMDIVGSAELRGGVAAESYGIKDLSVASLSLTGGVVSAGAATTKSVGILVGGVGYLGTTITSTFVGGGSAPLAYGLLHGKSPFLTVQGAVIHGQGSAAASTTTYGMTVDETTTILLSASEIKGSTSPTQATNNPPIATVGVQLGQTSLLDATATITGCDIDGGSVGRQRSGLVSNGVPLTLSLGTTTGTRATAPSAGGEVASRAVDLVSGFQLGDVVTISDNTLVAGGWGRNGNVPGALGIRNRAANVQLHVFGNTLIQGATIPDARTERAGIYLLESNASQVIENNQAILGGPGTWYASSGIYAAGKITTTTLMPVTIQNNILIAGNIDQSEPPDEAFGLRLRFVDGLVIDNQEITGGFSGGSVGLYAGVSTSENIWLEVARNTLHGGKGGGSPAALRAVGGQLSIHENVIDGCGIGGPPGTYPPYCGGGIRLEAAHDSQVANNYIFGGGIPACWIGTRYPGPLRFEHNLCATPQGGTVLRFEDVASNNPPVVRNNILDGGPVPATGTLPTIVFFGSIVSGMEISNNELVMTPACAVKNGATGACQGTTLATLNGMNGQSGMIIQDNVDVPMGFVDRLASPPIPENFQALLEV